MYRYILVWVLKKNILFIRRNNQPKLIIMLFVFVFVFNLFIINLSLVKAKIQTGVHINDSFCKASPIILSHSILYGNYMYNDSAYIIFFKKIVWI